MTQVGEKFKVKKKDVIALLDKRKDIFPWGNNPDEKYKCLVFWKKNVICMTVNEFYKIDDETYECIHFYTTIVGKTLDEYDRLNEEELASIAYNAWCSGAR